jgi:hypothetical protein
MPYYTTPKESKRKKSKKEKEEKAQMEKNDSIFNLRGLAAYLVLVMAQRQDFA